MQANYNDRKIFWGNEMLVIADLQKDELGVVKDLNHKLVTGLVSVGSMEDQAETDNYPADDKPDHGVKKGATLLQGEMVFIQTDEELKEDFLGQKKTVNGIGYTPTGNFRSKVVQYLIKGRKKNKTTGEYEDGWRIVVYPNMTPTAEPTSESETDSVDGVDPIQWTFAVQATASDLYLNDGIKVPLAEYEVWGKQAQAFEEKMEAGLFIMMPDTSISGGTPVVPDAPTGLTAQFETNGDVTVTWTPVSGAQSYVTHYGDANETTPTDLTYMGYTETNTWTLAAADVPTMVTDDVLTIHVQTYNDLGVGATDVEKARYLHDGQFTGSAWSEAVTVTKQ